MDENREHDPVFYYNRERRVANGPESVQKMYSGENAGPRPGIFRVLTSSRGSRLMLMTVIFMTAMVFFISFFGLDSNERTIGGIPVTLQAFQFEDTVYAALKLTEVSGLESPVTYGIGVYWVDAGGNVIAADETSGVYDGSAVVLRFTSADYDIRKVEAVVEAGEKTGTVSTTVDRE